MTGILSRQADRLRALRATRIRLREGKCPTCQMVLQRSRSRSPLERFRKRLSTKRPYRCPNCGWRRWLVPLRVAGHPDYWVVKCDDPDLHPVDECLTGSVLPRVNDHRPSDAVLVPIGAPAETGHRDLPGDDRFTLPLPNR